MLRSMNEIIGYRLSAGDGEVGKCKDFLFHDHDWAVRYMVADTSKWLPGRKVLIPQVALAEADWKTRRFSVKMTKGQIRNSPPLDEDAPVSRRYEKQWFDYYGWPYYWTGDRLRPPQSSPTEVYLRTQEGLVEEKRPLKPQTGLRSVQEVVGYHIRATDGEIGHVENFIVDDEMWVLRYMVVDTRNWLPGRKILVSPGWINAIEWADEKVEVGLTRKAIRNGPEYNPSEPVNREYEAVLYDFYGRPHYWEE